jgi:outer membrane protein assembly factor BamB
MYRGTLVILLAASPILADDWPQWMGPNRDGHWNETGILQKFPTGGPKKLWSHPIGEGYGGPAVADGKVYVLDYQATDGTRGNSAASLSSRKGKERVLCLDAKTGEEVWNYEYDCPYKLSYASGPRCTPTVSGGKVYALGAMGNLHVLDASTGSPVWSKDFKTDYKAKTPMWGFAGHPLVYKNTVICLVGGESLLVAFDKDTGKEAWKSLTTPGEGLAGYCSPVVIEAGGTKQLLIWHPEKLASVSPDDGKRYWDVPLKPSFGMSIMAPVKSGDRLFAGGIGWAAVTLKLDPDKPAVTEVWRGEPNKTNGLYPVNSPPMIEDGILYGTDQPGPLRAVELDTGKRLWATTLPVIGKEEDPEDRNAHGSGTAFLVKNGDRYFIFGESGHLVIARLSPKGYEEIDRAKLLDPTNEAFKRPVVWSHPAFANKCVFARNDKEIVCCSLAE